MKIAKIKQLPEQDAPELLEEPELLPIAQKFFDSVQNEYKISDCSGLSLLRRAATIHADIISFEEIIKKEGHTVISRLGDLKSHPLLSDLHKARSNFVTALKALNLDVEPIGEPVRPSGKSGRYI